MNPITEKIELLAPGGDLDSIKAAIVAGADAVYCGLDRFNARNRAKNIAVEDLPGIVRLAHRKNCNVFVTLNIIIVESEFPALVNLLNKLVNIEIDGLIVQDLGLFYLLTHYYKRIPIHASTQLTTHNEGQIEFLNRLAATRVNLSRELNIQEIKELTVAAHKNNLLAEVFVHGSNCLSFSGICYLSSVHGGNSGNRGRCSQPCRDKYVQTAAGNDFPLNLKDNSAYADLGELAASGVDSIKIEGRIKKSHYVYTVVKAFREQLQRLYQQDALQIEDTALRKVFNRDFTDSFLQGDISSKMFIDNPRDYSAQYRSQMYRGSSADNLERAKRELYDEKTEIINEVQQKIARLSTGKVPLQIRVSGKNGVPLTLTVETPDETFTVHSDANLAAVRKKSASTECVGSEMLLLRLKNVGETGYFIDKLLLNNLQEDLFLSFRELTAIKKKIIFILNGRTDLIAPVDVPRLSAVTEKNHSASLSVLIAAKEDLYLSNETDVDMYFQLPDSFAEKYDEFVEIFKKNKNLIPWFSTVIMEVDYHAAIAFLQELQPAQIVVNNTGIAWAAYRRNISWIAGPYLNSVNSFSLLCMKEHFNCAGAFISNELEKNQIKHIKKPNDFKLYYSIYHPIPLMTSRQCLFHQVTGCEKNRLDSTCIQQCAKASTITNLKNDTFFLTKKKGDYHRLYNEKNYLNTDIITDIRDCFSEFFIDLRDVQTGTVTKVSKPKLVHLFEDLLAGKRMAAEEIKQSVQPTSGSQYQKGI